MNKIFLKQSIFDHLVLICIYFCEFSPLSLYMFLGFLIFMADCSESGYFKPFNLLYAITRFHFNLAARLKKISSLPWNEDKEGATLSSIAFLIENIQLFLRYSTYIYLLISEVCRLHNKSLQSANFFV